MQTEILGEGSWVGWQPTGLCRRDADGMGFTVNLSPSPTAVTKEGAGGSQSLGGWGPGGGEVEVTSVSRDEHMGQGRVMAPVENDTSCEAHPRKAFFTAKDRNLCLEAPRMLSILTHVSHSRPTSWKPWDTG